MGVCVLSIVHVLEVVHLSEAETCHITHSMEIS